MEKNKHLRSPTPTLGGIKEKIIPQEKEWIGPFLDLSLDHPVGQEARHLHSEDPSLERSCPARQMMDITGYCITMREKFTVTRTQA